MFFDLFCRSARPFDSGYLPEREGHRVYFAQYGNPKGIPILRFHGGPGSHSKEKHTHVFNLRKHRVILFDQRGCGQSQPAGMTENNTLTALIEDAKNLMAHFGLTKVVIYGGSWGATLALAFAQKYPDMVDRLVLTQVFLARKKDIDWIASDIARCYPDIMDVLTKDIPKGVSLRDYYATQMLSGDRTKATSAYGSYERMVGQTAPTFSNEPPTPEHIQAFGVYMHYDSMNYGLSENQLLGNMGVIKHIPTLIIHNRLDLVCPVDQAWEVHKALPQSKIVIVPDMGHGSDLLDKTIKQELCDWI